MLAGAVLSLAGPPALANKPANPAELCVCLGESEPGPPSPEVFLICITTALPSTHFPVLKLSCNCRPQLHCELCDTRRDVADGSPSAPRLASDTY